MKAKIKSDTKLREEEQGFLCQGREYQTERRNRPEVVDEASGQNCLTVRGLIETEFHKNA
jgi:hypothetical protein